MYVFIYINYINIYIYIYIAAESAVRVVQCQSIVCIFQTVEPAVGGRDRGKRRVQGEKRKEKKGSWGADKTRRTYSDRVYTTTTPPGGFLQWPRGGAGDGMMTSVLSRS